MTDHEMVTASTEATVVFAQQYACTLIGGDIVALSGDLGAGKTTFSQAVLAALGAEGPFTSPTFSVIKQYDLSADSQGAAQGISVVYHIDAYRIVVSDMIELGWQEMQLMDKGLILVEWPEKIADLLPDRCKYVDFHTLSHNQRRITY